MTLTFGIRFFEAAGCLFFVQETIHGHLKIASKLADSGYARVAGIEMTTNIMHPRNLGCVYTHIMDPENTLFVPGCWKTNCWIFNELEKLKRCPSH